MLKIQNSLRSLWFALLTTIIFVSILALDQTVPQLIGQDINIWRSKWTALLLAFILNIALGIFFVVRLKRGLLDKTLEQIEVFSIARPWTVLAIFIIPAALVLFWFIRIKIFGSILPQLFPAVWVFFWISLISALVLKSLTKHSLASSFVAMVLFQSVIFRCWSILNIVTDFPFTLDYSETSRFYYGSLVFSQSTYGMDLPLSTLHPSRYLLQSIPFIIPNLPLWVHRLWQALLWILLTGTSAWLLARRMHLSNKYLTLIITAWGFVYFLQGTVYYHLQICVIIILLGFSTKRFGQSLVAVILASLWAGISRVNWFPVPTMLAIAIHLLEEPVSEYKNLWQYIKRPVVWAVIGLSAALLSQFLYVFWSGNAGNVGDFGTAFASDLIWSRLLPNVTYPLGVLPGILLVMLPLLLILLYVLQGHGANWHFVRPWGLFTMLIVLFLGGLVVSTKIGGGADIHNMDAFMVMLAIIVCSFFAGQVRSEVPNGSWGAIPVWVIVLAALIPAIFSMQGARSRFSYDHVQAQKDLDALQSIIADTTDQGGEVLFINERHLVTFHIIQSPLLTPDYEVITLMEMAMAGNQDYLDHFYRDLANHRFSVIITSKQRVVKKTDEPFAEENNIWIDSVTRPLLCYYERELVLESSDTLILLPSKAEENCP